jgi:hypothetical protein
MILQLEGNTGIYAEEAILTVPKTAVYRPIFGIV